MSQKNHLQEAKIQWTKMFRKLYPLYDPERVPLHEALWTKGILDQAA